MTNDELYMQRCIQLASFAKGRVAPNPLVGALLVHDNRIIGEGYHEYYGGPHAEVNCIRSVKLHDQHLVEKAVLYVSLEPCAHFGKTPPCAELIVKSGIKKVVVGIRDPFIEVNGKGIERLQGAGIDVITDTLKDQCKKLNKNFFTFHSEHRPFIILKWAQTQNRKIAAGPAITTLRGNGVQDADQARLYISNEYTNRIVHKWRSEEASILVGTNTAMLDDPELTNRHWRGSSPIRLVIDMDLKLPSSLKMFNDNKSLTIVFNSIKHDLEDIALGKVGSGTRFYQVTHDVSVIHQVLHALYQLKIQSVLVEGGSRLLQSFIDEQMWDEARVITNSSLHVETGISAPSLTNHNLINEEIIMSDLIHYFVNKY
jgi:diaminohydroxyphosphoribosylaminopyrimidine deaminase/5-amino-6-(5-phosphoribosylamino)uracil reductase